mgnify:CR=1 FL=1|tara:strand:- start:12103 stop:13095 length:993 start_codon:yes stop_codon:yes gene_type:complete
MENHISNLKKTKVWNKLEDDIQFDEITDFLRSEGIKEDYTIIKNFLDYLSEKHEIEENLLDSKFIVSILMINKFNDFIIGKNRVEKEELIVQKSSEIYNMIKNDQIVDINKKLVTFKIIFENWKKDDKEQQLNLLCEMYYNYQKSINESKNDEGKSEYVDELEKTKTKIIKSMKMITRDYKKYLDNYKFKNVEYDEKVQKMMYVKLKMAYWNNMRNLVFEKKNINVFKHILNDYKEIINDIKIRNFDYSKLNNFMDYEVKKQDLVYALTELGKYFIETNKSIDSENYDEIYDMLYQKLNNNNKYIIDIFKFCFERLDVISKIKENLDSKK